MKEYALSDICHMAGGILKGDKKNLEIVKDLLTDSRRLVIPSNTLFIAIKSRKNDGHSYIGELFEKGVNLFLVSSLPENYQNQFQGAAFIVVEDTLVALQRIARLHREQFNLKMVAITGSNGKTIIKEWLFQLLMNQVNIVRNPKSYNSQIGVPLSVWQIQEAHQLGIFEAGISLPGEMENLASIIQPDIGIFTNIGPAHDEGFSSIEEKISEKLHLFINCRTLIYCADHYTLASQIKKWHKENPSVNLFDWSFLPGSRMQVLSLAEKEKSTAIHLIFDRQDFVFEIPFTDKASVENALHCLAFLFFSGVSADSMSDRIQQLQSVAMRMEMKEGINNSLIINDSYNSDLYSLLIALDFLNAQKRYKNHTLILSDMLQTGMKAPELYAEVASMISARKISRFIGIGMDISSQKHLFPGKALFFDDVASFISRFDIVAFKEEAILLKGARVFGFEKLVSLLQQKDHQTVLEINLEALIHNLNVFRSLVNPSVRIMAMVKALAYGSGSVEIASILQFHKVDYLAVAYADEGKELRKGGIQIPVIVMNPEVRSFDILLKYRLQPEVYGINLLKRLSAAVSDFEEVNADNPFVIHLKLDTGMHRLGFLPSEHEQMIDVLKQNPALKVNSVFSHLAASDDILHDQFSENQISLFTKWCDEIQDALGYKFLRHICNTTAISRFPSAHFDMVRPGVGLYGVSGDAAIQPLLQNVSTFKSVISQVKIVQAGQTIGYNRAARTKSETKIAIIPVGYADGLNRRLSDGTGKLFVNNRLVPIVGKISMDMCAVDVTGIDVKEGDEVIIFGKENPVQKVASDLGTIPYEVFTSVSQRVKRIYFHA